VGRKPCGDPARRPKLFGRRSECEALDTLVADVVAGGSRVLVLRGDAGAGKSALLGYVRDRAVGWNVATAAGVESEMELDYSGLHQLCAPVLGHVENLPGPQRDALATVFGLSAGPAPDRFLVALAALSLFAELAEPQPLICIVDDAHWLDGSSAQVLGFVARRLLADRIAIVCAARTGIGDHVLAGLPDLTIGGLGDDDARALLLANVFGPLDAAVRDQIVAESHGNPLALLELPRTRSAAELGGGFRLPYGQPVAGKVEQSYARRLEPLPAQTRLLVLAAAAEPLGDPLLLHRAADALGLELAAADPAVDAGLLAVGGRVEFAHPLARSAAYRASGEDDRQRVHRALAEATDVGADPDRRAWHRARASPGPDEEIAIEVERSAARAQARGGVAAAAAFLQRSVELTGNPERRAERSLAAAQASLQAGAIEAAGGLLATAEANAPDELQRARIDLIRGQIAFATSHGGDAPGLLLRAAKRLEPLDLRLARETYLDAMIAAVFAGRLAGGVGLLEVAQAALAAPSPPEPRPSDLLIDSWGLLITEGYGAGVPKVKQALSAFGGQDLEPADGLRWLWLASHIAHDVWDFEAWDLLAARHVEVARATGALTVLPVALIARVAVHLFAGELGRVEILVEEANAVNAATAGVLPPYGGLVLAAWRGDGVETSRLIASATKEMLQLGEGQWLTATQWAAAVLDNGRRRYEDALSAARAACDDPHELGVSVWALSELTEAASRCGRREEAAAAFERLAASTSASGTDWGLGVEARARALLSSNATAEALYREAIDRLGRTRLRPDLARAQLLYGEWLRREGRRLDAREQLRTAHETFAAIGMEAFDERARGELIATGVKVRRRSAQTRDQLTPQEEQIARLAREGLSNPEIGAHLFISARTVEWHLRKVFTKLDITSRRQLRSALPEEGPPVAVVA
jgi:DNA-binding CsgD family transcriptional regulator